MNLGVYVPVTATTALVIATTAPVTATMPAPVTATTAMRKLKLK
jgi:hypothetical protein